MVEDEVPITQWEAERKKEVSLSAGTNWDRAVTAWGALVGGGRKGKDSGQSWRFAGEGDGVGLAGTGRLLHLERDCPANPCHVSHFSRVRTFSWSQSVPW